MITIVVDSTADLPAELLERYGIGVVPVLLQIGQETMRDNVDLSRDAFYQRLVESPELPRTAAPPIGAFMQVFEPLLEAGHEVISLSVAGALSSTYGAAQQAARLLGSDRITCFDSATTTLAMGFQALVAAEAAQAGASRDEVLELLGRLREQAVLYFGVETLHYLEKGGRIGRVKAMLGTMLSVKPIIELRAGAVLPVEQVRTWRRVPGRLVELCAARGRYARLAVLYTSDRAVALDLADACAAAGLMPREHILVAQVAAALGAHAGPGAVGIAGLLA